MSGLLAGPFSFAAAAGPLPSSGTLAAWCLANSSLLCFLYLSILSARPSPSPPLAPPPSIGLLAQLVRPQAFADIPAAASSATERESAQRNEQWQISTVQEGTNTTALPKRSRHRTQREITDSGASSCLHAAACTADAPNHMPSYTAERAPRPVSRTA